MYSIAVMGNSGSGKSTSLRNLDYKKTFIIDSDCKGLTWRGWKKQYNKENKNYLQTSNIDTIENCIKIINEKEEYKHIEVIIIDTINAIMLDHEMIKMKEKGYEKWVDLAQNIYGIISQCNRLRNDLISVCMFHLDDVSDDNGVHLYRIKTNGRKLEKIQLESKFPIVLLSKSEGQKYFFETQSNFSTAKSPMGLFQDLQIENDLKYVIEKYKEFENDFPFTEEEIRKGKEKEKTDKKSKLELN